MCNCEPIRRVSYKFSKIFSKKLNEKLNKALLMTFQNYLMKSYIELC